MTAYNSRETWQNWKNGPKYGKFNPLKCELLTITNQRSPLKFTYHINDVPIKEADFVKYLGVVIDSKLTWKEHIKQVLSKSNTSLSLTYKILNNLITIPSHNFRPVSYHTSGHEYHFQHLQCNCDSYRYSFFPTAIRLWNSLPSDIASCNDFNDFDQKLKNHFCINYMRYTP